MTRFREKSAVTKPVVVPDAPVKGSRVNYRQHFITPGCTVLLQTAVDDGEWIDVDNGDEVPGVHPGCVVRGKVTLQLAQCTAEEPYLNFDLILEVDVDHGALA